MRAVLLPLLACVGWGADPAPPSAADAIGVIEALAPVADFSAWEEKRERLAAAKDPGAARALLLGSREMPSLLRLTSDAGAEDVTLVLASADPAHRILGAHVARTLRDPALAPALAAILDDWREVTYSYGPRFRLTPGTPAQAAAMALHSFGDAAKDVVTEAFARPSARRALLIVCAGEWANDERLRERVAAGLEDDDEQVRLAALTGLRSSSTVAALRPSLLAMARHAARSPSCEQASRLIRALRRADADAEVFAALAPLALRDDARDVLTVLARLAADDAQRAQAADLAWMRLEGGGESRLLDAAASLLTQLHAPGLERLRRFPQLMTPEARVYAARSWLQHPEVDLAGDAALLRAALADPDIAAYALNTLPRVRAEQAPAAAAALAAARVGEQFRWRRIDAICDLAERNDLPWLIDHCAPVRGALVDAAESRDPKVAARAAGVLEQRRVKWATVPDG